MKLIGKGKSFDIGDVRILSAFGRIRGLMFLSREKAQPLLFRFSRPTRLAIHSFFVFFPFLAIWLDDKNNILETKVVKPFAYSARPVKSFSKLLEIPLNRKYKEKVENIVGSF